MSIKKLPPGSFIAPKAYEFVVECSAPLLSDTFNPTLPARTKEKPKIHKAAFTAKPLQKSSASSTSINPLDKPITANYPAPRTKNPPPAKTVKEILCEYEQELADFPKMASIKDLKPHILQTIQQRPFSAGAKSLALHDREKAKTIAQLREREHANSGEKTSASAWMDQLKKEQTKPKRLQKGLPTSTDTELKDLLKRIHTEKPPAILPNKFFTLNNKPIKSPQLPPSYNTSTLRYNPSSEPDPKQIKPKLPATQPSVSLISDDDSFINNISSPEDFEVLSDTST